MFSRDIIEHAKSWALLCYPNESCGIIFEDENGENQYKQCKNVHSSPHENFAIDANEIAPFITGNKLKAIVHSHTTKQITEKSSPSKMDMESQLETNVPWGIIDTDGVVVSEPYWWGDFILEQELLGQEFHAGVNDCLTLIRKALWQKFKIKMPEFPRQNLWWEKGENMYVDCFEAAGFFQISKEELKDGDVIITKVNSDVLNHGGVYLHNSIDGKGLILHHLPNRLSRREPATPWINRAEMFLRHKELNA